MKNLIINLIQKILASYARNIIRWQKPFVIAVTGSVGKSSTKEAVFRVLEDHFGSGQVRRSLGNLNNEIGMPLTILGYEFYPRSIFWPVLLVSAFFRQFQKNYPQYLILELGIDKPRDMDHFLSIVRPNIAIVTSVAGAHMVNFKTLEQYQEEKLKLIEAAETVILNGDDKVLVDQRPKGETFWIGYKNKKVDFFATDIAISFQQTAYNIFSLGQKIAIKTKVFGKQNIYSQLFAFAVGKAINIHGLELKKSIEKIGPVPGRMNAISGDNGVLIIDDTYNSNPTSALAALDTLAEIPHSGRKVAILGNMNELGQIEREMHCYIAKNIPSGIDLVIFVGQNAKDQQKQYREALAFSSRGELEEKLQELIHPGDLVLVKASQNNNYFEELVKILMADKGQAKDLLVRQSDAWMKKK